jgi:hypothetical protein
MARLVLFFSLSFALLFLAATGLRYLAVHVEWVRRLSREPEIMLTGFIAAGRWALSLALYGSLLLSLSYAARGRFSALMTAACLTALSLGFTLGIFLGLERMGNVPPARAAVPVLGEPGLILTNAIRHSETAVVLLNGPTDPAGPRVAAVPGQALNYQTGARGAALNLPPVPFMDETPWFLRSMAIDLRLSAGQLEQRFQDGLPSLLIYAGALIIVLGSLSCVLNLSAWPLANLFLGCIIFRGVLALETFLNSPEMQDVFEFFLENRLPVSLSVPLIFSGAGLLVYLYSILVFLVKKRRADED